VDPVGSYCATKQDYLADLSNGDVMCSLWCGN